MKISNEEHAKYRIDGGRYASSLDRVKIVRQKLEMQRKRDIATDAVRGSRYLQIARSTVPCSILVEEEGRDGGTRPG